MHQVLFWIPFKFFGLAPHGVPIYGFGTMLFLAFIVCIWLAGRLAMREGISKDRVADLALWVFVGGIIGARIVFMIQYKVPWQHFFRIWEGGIVFYGSAIGGWVGYGLGWWFMRKKYRIPTWRLADAIAPVVCVGLMLGRIGCFLNGCCYGHVCTDCGARGMQFPVMTSPARELVVNQGYQTLAGFALDEAVQAMQSPAVPLVGAVEPDSPAAHAGLQRGDVITKVNEQTINSTHQLVNVLQTDWPRGEQKVALTVMRHGAAAELPPFTPRTLALHPTQIYESISMFLIFLLLLAFYPYRRHYGQVFVLLMLCYAVHRFFNETLRNDTDPVWMNLTLSQVGSLAVFAGGIGLELFLRQYSERVAPAAPATPGDKAAKANA